MGCVDDADPWGKKPPIVKPEHSDLVHQLLTPSEQDVVERKVFDRLIMKILDQVAQVQAAGGRRLDMNVDRLSERHHVDEAVAVVINALREKGWVAEAPDPRFRSILAPDVDIRWRCVPEGPST